MEESESGRPFMQKPDVFTVGAKIGLQYRSTQETRGDRDKGVVGFVIADEDGVLVIEEYSNFARANEHRHVILNAETMDVFSQTEAQTVRIGQATEVNLWAPPWESKHDTIAGGIRTAAHMRSRLTIIEEGVYNFVDPAQLDGYEDWSPEDECESPIPEEIVGRNSETAYQPEFSIDL